MSSKDPEPQKEQPPPPPPPQLDESVIKYIARLKAPEGIPWEWVNSLHPQLSGSAAHRWAQTWARAWPQRDVEAIAALYAETVVYRSPAFRAPDPGLAGVRKYLGENLGGEENFECAFGQPIVSGDRAAVEWWASWTEQGQELWFAGVTMLRFDNHGQVVEHRDYYDPVARRQ